MKLKLKGRRFETIEEIQAESQRMLDTERKDFQEAFQKCSSKPQFIYIVVLLVPAVPLTQETSVFCVPELHSK
jgi:hypothetical protein